MHRYKMGSLSVTSAKYLRNIHNSHTYDYWNTCSGLYFTHLGPKSAHLAKFYLNSALVSVFTNQLE
jgi:hypothetical protein